MSLASRALPSIQYARNVLGELLFNWAKRALWLDTWAPIARLPNSVLIREASPFLWRVLETLAMQDGPPSDEARRLALALTADSFIHFVPAAAVVLPEALPTTVALPFTGQMLAMGRGRSVLVPAPHLRLAIASGDAALTDDADAVRFADSSSQAGRHFVLTVSQDPRLIDEMARSHVVANPGRDALEKFGVMLREGLRLIRMADASLHQTVTDDVRYYALIQGAEDTHYSFTLSSLNGVVFLSECRSRVLLAEAIVHEHGHGDLYALAELDPLVRPEADGIFYSPWRNDPRPLIGLFHALYVFENVAYFLEQLSRGNRQAVDIDIDERMAFINLQLGVGIAQLDPNDFTPCGLGIANMIIDSMREREALEHCRSAGKSMQRLREHSAAWCSNRGIENGTVDLDALLSKAARVLKQGLQPDVQMIH